MNKKNLILIVISIALSCGIACDLIPRKGNTPIIEDGYAIDYAILYNEQVEVNDSLTGIVKLYKDSIAILNTQINNAKFDYKELKAAYDEYYEKAILYEYKIERIKAYDKIVRNNNSQSKYFLGWVRRVIED